MIQVSVIICTQNPRPQYFDRVLAALRNQVLPYNQWELLLVDNASEPAVAPRWDITWHQNARQIRENEPGLAPARRRGMAEATADLLVFVDDDNVLAKDYLSEALRLKTEWDVLGTWGSGMIVPEFEHVPADHLTPYFHYLALRRNATAYWSNMFSCGDAIPWGAGMCVRASVAREYRRLYNSETIHITDRKEQALFGHGDYEIAFVGCGLGLGMGVFPELKITHLIPKERVSDEYFLRVAEAYQISGELLNYKWFGGPSQDPFSLRGVLSLAKNLLLTGGFHRRHYLAQLRGKIAARRALAKYESSKGT